MAAVYLGSMAVEKRHNSLIHWSLNVLFLLCYFVWAELSLKKKSKVKEGESATPHSKQEEEVFSLVAIPR